MTPCGIKCNIYYKLRVSTHQKFRETEMNNIVKTTEIVSAFECPHCNKLSRNTVALNREADTPDLYQAMPRCEHCSAVSKVTQPAYSLLSYYEVERCEAVNSTVVKVGTESELIGHLFAYVISSMSSNDLFHDYAAAQDWPDTTELPSEVIESRLDSLPHDQREVVIDWYFDNADDDSRAASYEFDKLPQTAPQIAS